MLNRSNNQFSNFNKEKLLIQDLVLQEIIPSGFFLDNFYTTINASKDTYNSNTTSKTWQENITLASSNIAAVGIDAAINALQISLGLAMSRSKSDTIKDIEWEKSGNWVNKWFKKEGIIPNPIYNSIY